MWELHPSGTVRVCPSLDKNCFTSFCLIYSDEWKELLNNTSRPHLSDFFFHTDTKNFLTHLTFSVAKPFSFLQHPAASYFLKPPLSCSLPFLQPPLSCSLPFPEASPFLKPPLPCSLSFPEASPFLQPPIPAASPFLKPPLFWSLPFPTASPLLQPPLSPLVT